MNKYHALMLGLVLISACTSNLNQHVVTRDLTEASIDSDFSITDLNKYGCGLIDQSILVHVLKTGTVETASNIHDHYSVTGCSIKGTLTTERKVIGFKFDYGGILYLSNGTIIGCAEKCCTDGFEYCSWDKDDLKGN